MPVLARRVDGLILVGGDAAAALGGVTAVYAWVSSAGQRADPDQQVARVTAWAAARGLPAGRVVTENGSALDGHRSEFLALLRGEQLTVMGRGAPR